MNTMQALGDGSFQREVLESTVPVLVEFGATWCPPCRAMEPHLRDVAATHAGRLKVGTVDADDNPVTVGKFGVRGLPTLILFRGGRPVASLVGAVPRQKLEAWMSPHL